MAQTSILQHIISDGLQTLNRDSLSPHQWQVLHHLQGCRTESMGSFQWHCRHCDKDTTWYCSCRDRHCPTCQGAAREKWLETRRQDLLPVTYHHVVFTLPHQFNRWTHVHPDVIYKSLFKSAWETLNHFANKRHHLEGKLGMMAVLHTWGQSLCQHIHLHCLIPGGVITTENAWQGTRNSGYLLPVKALSVVFKKNMLNHIDQASKDEELTRLNVEDIHKAQAEVSALNWVVYSKPAISHADSVVQYLARYCNRIGVSPSRLSLVSKHEAVLRYKDYRTGNNSSMSLSTEELLRRFLLHVLPKGFMRLRYYGFMANAIRRKSLNVIRKSLSVVIETKDKEPDEMNSVVCPYCSEPGMLLISIVKPKKALDEQRTR